MVMCVTSVRDTLAPNGPSLPFSCQGRDLTGGQSIMPHPTLGSLPLQWIREKVNSRKQDQQMQYCFLIRKV